MLLCMVFSLFITGVSIGGDFNYSFESGEQAFRLGDYSQAAKHYSQALAEIPTELKARFRLGQSCFLLEDYAQAKDQFQYILQTSPGNITARVYFAESLAAMGYNEEALTHLDWILKVQPEHERARYVHGKVMELEMVKVKKDEDFVPEKMPPAHVKPLPIVKQTQNVKIVKNPEGSKQLEAQRLVNTPSTPSAPSAPSERVVERRPVKDPTRKVATSQKTIDKLKENNIKVEPTPTPEGYIHVPARPASILPIEYQTDDEEDFFKNYPASFLENKVEPEAAMAKASLGNLNSNYAYIPKNKNNNIAKKEEKATVANLLNKYSNSFLINLEGTKYYMEIGALSKAEESLKRAETIAYNSGNSRGVMEAKIYRSLLFVYNLDFAGFGQYLMGLKSSMPVETYQAYLDIYNEGLEAKDEVEKSRIAAGVAMGATHYAVASKLLEKVFVKYSDDPIIGRLLSDAQINSLDYSGAEITLSQIARAYPDSGEAYLNLARYYLTVKYKPELVRDYGEYAQRLDPADGRTGIILGLLDYSEGNFEKGVSGIKELLPSIEDPTLKAVCEKIIIDGEESNGADFIRLLALPKTQYALEQTNRLLSEDYLKRGSFFMAAEGFEEMNDMAELGRTYLGLGSTLVAAEEYNTGEEVVALGKKLLGQVLAVNPSHGRANLYISLYYFEHNDLEAASLAVNKGLEGAKDPYTIRRLKSVANIIES